jgi:RNA polymerase sigma factor (sigma-70 family)
MQIAYKLMLDELVNGCRRGDSIAQRKLYEYFYGTMMGVCMRYVESVDDASAILNEGFLKVFTKIDTFDSKVGNLEGWIRRIMVNTAIDHYRKMVREARTVELQNATYNSVQAMAPDTLEAEAIMKLVQQLPPAYRTVFNLYAIEGYNHKEIAEQLGITEGTSKSNLFKARAKLQTALETLKNTQTQRYG